MNMYIKKLLSFLTLQPRTVALNTVIGYLNSLIINKDSSWSDILKYIIDFDKCSLYIFEQDTEQKAYLQQYSTILNQCYTFINEEYTITFLKEAAFDNSRVANIKDYGVYVAARRLLLNEYEKNKGAGT